MFYTYLHTACCAVQFCNNCQIDKIPIVSVKSEAIITEVYTQICSCRRPVLESCSRADCLQKVSTLMQHHAEACRLLCQSWTVYKVTENVFFLEPFLYICTDIYQQKCIQFLLQGSKSFRLCIVSFVRELSRRCQNCAGLRKRIYKIQSNSCFQLMNTVDSAHSLYLKINQIDDSVRKPTPILN